MQGRPPIERAIPLPLVRLTAAVIIVLLTSGAIARSMARLWMVPDDAVPQYGIFVLFPQNLSWRVLVAIARADGSNLVLLVFAMLLFMIRTPVPLRRIWMKSW